MQQRDAGMHRYVFLVVLLFFFLLGNLAAFLLCCHCRLKLLLSETWSELLSDIFVCISILHK